MKFWTLKRAWVVMQNEWALSIRDPKFWIATLITPVILFLIYLLLQFLVKFAVIEDPREQLLESDFVTNTESLLEEFISPNRDAKSDLLKYMVLDENGSLAQKIRDRILQIDQSLFLRYFFQKSVGEYDHLVAIFGEPAVGELFNILETASGDLEGVAKHEHLLLKLNSTLYGSQLLDAEFREFLEEFSIWWSEHLDQIKSQVPAVSVNSFQEASVNADIANREFAENLLTTDEIIGYFVLPANVHDENAAATFVVGVKTPKSRYLELVNWYRSIATNVLVQERFNLAKLDISSQYFVKRPDFATEDFVEVESSSILPFQGIDKFLYIGLSVVLSLIFVMIGTRLVGVFMTEKSSKLLDSLLVKVPPNQLLDGKLWGTALIGVTVLIAWLVLIVLFTSFSAVSDITIDPALIEHLFRFDVILNFLLFLVLTYALFGYFLLGFTTMFSQLSTVISLLFIVLTGVALFGTLTASSVHLFPITIQNILSFFPLTSPFVMVARSTTLPDPLVYCAIVLVMFLSIYGSRALGGLMFKRGISVEVKVPSVH
ncbi:MAG: ABC transporter permease subunit [Gammaproteobacteria bacterium]|nr:ABC transporter permease subunit [Gammaproteobacteria bacterium]MYK42860.1 ABC transporter permease subunit [Gammaproteobacteria bacterium]